MSRKPLACPQEAAPVAAHPRRESGVLNPAAHLPKRFSELVVVVALRPGSLRVAVRPRRNPEKGRVAAIK